MDEGVGTSDSLLLHPTDVLSFPMLSYEKAGDFSFLEEESEDDFNPDTGEVMLGDIIISVDKVSEQAQSYGHSPKREFAFLIVHSMLLFLLFRADFILGCTAVFDDLYPCLSGI